MSQYGLSSSDLTKLNKTVEDVVNKNTNANTSFKEAQKAGYEGSFSDYMDIVNNSIRTGKDFLSLLKEGKGIFGGMFGGSTANAADTGSASDTKDEKKKFLGMPMAIGISVTVATALILGVVIYKVVKK